MNVVIRVKRQRSPESAPFWQDFNYDGSPSDSVAAALRELNARTSLTDAKGAPAEPIAWDCGCCAGRCGACAMLVNGRPTLACKAFLGKSGSVVLEPLSKFPLVRDLVVDRGVIFETLKKMHLWLSERGREDERLHDLRYQSAACLMCGCCLEVCPNFSAGGSFAGAAAAAAAYRLLSQEGDAAHRADEGKAYRRIFYSGCGTSLACEKVCPAGIPVTELISRSNAAAVWRRL